MAKQRSSDLLDLEGEQTSNVPKSLLLSLQPPEKSEEEQTRIKLSGDKPKFVVPDEPEVLSRLKDFLPKMAEANRQLDEQIAAGVPKETFQLEAEDGEEGKQYVEMRLGLGVLEEKDATVNEDNIVIPGLTRDADTDTDTGLNFLTPDGTKVKPITVLGDDTSESTNDSDSQGT